MRKMLIVCRMWTEKEKPLKYQSSISIISPCTKGCGRLLELPAVARGARLSPTARFLLPPATSWISSSSSTRSISVRGAGTSLFRFFPAPRLRASSSESSMMMSSLEVEPAGLVDLSLDLAGGARGGGGAGGGGALGRAYSSVHCRAVESWSFRLRVY